MQHHQFQREIMAGREVNETVKHCRKCLLKELDPEMYLKHLHTYIEHLDEDIKAEPGKYQERLDICRQCGLLMEGMCRGCGCFVELRAVILKNVCPYDKW